MLLAAITDPQEAQFRKLGVQLRNSPQMLRDLLYRSVEEIAPTAFLPVVEAGIADGSLQVTEPTAFAEVVALLANLWLSPLVFADGPEKRKQKLAFLCTLCEPTGLYLAPLQPYLDQL